MSVILLCASLSGTQTLFVALCVCGGRGGEGGRGDQGYRKEPWPQKRPRVCIDESVPARVQD